MPIEQLRNMLIIGLVLVGFLIWQAWQEDYGPKPPAPAATADGSAAAPGVDVPAVPAPPAAQSDAGSTPVAGAGTAPGAGVPSVPVKVPNEVAAAPPTGGVSVETDLLSVVIDPVGGTLRTLRLKAFDESPEQPDQPFTLLTPQPPNVFQIWNGLVGNDAAPTHEARFETASSAYTLGDGVDELVVPMTWRSPDGVEVIKRLRFRRDSYVVRIEHEIRNNSGADWPMRMYGSLVRADVPRKGGLFLGGTYTYTGGVVSRPDKPYQKIQFDDMASQDLEETWTGGWAAIIQHYFVAAVIPPGKGESYYYTRSLGNSLYALGVAGPGVLVAPGKSATLSLEVYAGPKDQDRLEPLAPYLERTVDYGWLWFIAEPLFYALRWIHGFVGNWGFSIILLTIVIKLLFFHLSATSYKSMARMRKLQPRITQLRERYGSDKQRMNQAMMELYKTEKINPLGGCLPILVQIPVFISLYWMLLESVELRQSPFILWITDLSEHDPYFVLPLLMGASMFVQQKLNPSPPDPVQAKIMMMLPIVFTFLFLFFPSGLVLYWLVNNLLSIAQQWVITRKIVGPDG